MLVDRGPVAHHEGRQQVVSWSQFGDENTGAAGARSDWESAHRVRVQQSAAGFPRADNVEHELVAEGLRQVPIQPLGEPAADPADVIWWQLLEGSLFDADPAPGAEHVADVAAAGDDARVEVQSRVLAGGHVGAVGAGWVELEGQ